MGERGSPAPTARPILRRACGTPSLRRSGARAHGRRRGRRSPTPATTRLRRPRRAGRLPPLTTVGVVRQPQARRQRRTRGGGRTGPRRSWRRRCGRRRHNPRCGVSRRRARQGRGGRDLDAVGVRARRGPGGQSPAGDIGGHGRERLRLSGKGCSTMGPRRRRWLGRRGTGGATGGGGRRRRRRRARTERGRGHGDGGPACERGREPAKGGAWPSRPPRGPGGRSRRARQTTTDRAPRGGCSALRAERSLPLVCSDRFGRLYVQGGNYLHWLATAGVNSQSGNRARATLSALLGRSATKVGGTIVASK